MVPVRLSVELQWQQGIIYLSLRGCSPQNFLTPRKHRFRHWEGVKYSCILDRPNVILSYRPRD